MISRGRKNGTTYKTPGSCHLIAVVTNESPNLWHKRLCHMSEKRMKVMHLKVKLQSLWLIEIDIYEDCIFGKHKRVCFQTSRRTSKKDRPELIHFHI